LDLQLAVTDDPASVLNGHDSARARVLYSPRMWSELDDAQRSDARCAVVRYTFDGAELDKVARECGWERTQTGLESKR
jgi:hypothetical protein